MQIRRTSSLQNASSVNFQSTSKTSNVANHSAAPVDQLDISAEAQLISQTGASGDIRMDRVNDLRAQIASGRYETPDKIDAAVTRLLDQIG